jgi:DtxR family Mn-dependent transcriptional regulator
LAERRVHIDVRRRSIATVSVQNYIKAIYELAEEHDLERVSTNVLAERLSVASPSVSAMVKRLNEDKPPLIHYESHRGVSLTPEGQRQALEIIRHHRLIETFLVKVLGYRWDEVHEEAERLEHYISEKFEDRISEYLGHPEYDPHGAPIPTKDGRVPRVHYVSLTELPIDVTVKILRVRHDTPELLRYLTTLGIAPGEFVTVLKRAPFDGPVHIRLGEDADAEENAIGRNVAEMILVQVPADFATPEKC